MPKAVKTEKPQHFSSCALCAAVGGRGFRVTEVFPWDLGESSFHLGSATNLLWTIYTHLFWLSKWQRWSQQKGSAHTSQDREAFQGTCHNSLPWTLQRGLWGGAGSALSRVCALLLTADPAQHLYISCRCLPAHTADISFPSLISTDAGRDVSSP